MFNDKKKVQTTQDGYELNLREKKQLQKAFESMEKYQVASSDSEKPRVILHNTEAAMLFYGVDILNKHSYRGIKDGVREWTSVDGKGPYLPEEVEEYIIDELGIDSSTPFKVKFYKRLGVHPDEIDQNAAIEVEVELGTTK